MGNFLFVGLVLVIIAGIANLFFQVPALHLAINAVVVLIMSGLILFDTSRIINGGETNYISATLMLYMDLFNVFQSLLALLGLWGGEDFPFANRAEFVEAVENGGVAAMEREGVTIGE